MADIKFYDYSAEVKSALADLAEQALEEVSGELESQVKRNTPTGKIAGGQLKGSWKHRVTGSMMAGEFRADVGSTLERALWVEFGTGEYALPESGKPGRKGGWYIPVGSGEGHISEAVAKAYGFTIRNGKDGRKWVFTLGMEPQRPFWKAYTSSKNKLIKRIQKIVQGGLK